MSKHVHLLIDKDNLVATGDGLTTSLTESLARNERFISHFLQNGNNGRIINICENCLQHVENSNQTRRRQNVKDASLVKKYMQAFIES
jgi:hypothetical protein